MRPVRECPPIVDPGVDVSTGQRVESAGGDEGHEISPQLALDEVDCARDGFAIGHVNHQRHAIDLLSDFLHFASRACRDNDTHAVRGQPLRNRAADAAPPSCDQGDPCECIGEWTTPSFSDDPRAHVLPWSGCPHNPRCGK